MGDIRIDQYEAAASKIMPDLGQEIEDFKYYTWHITNWSQLKNRITGPEFEAGDWRWKILLYPNGNNNSDCVSIYLDFADPKGAQEGWHSCAQFALVMWNPKDPTQYICHHAHHRFTVEEPDWGFTKFYDLRKLLAPSDNRTRAIIENDSTNITAFVRIFKDPTGVLWRKLIKYDSKKETGYVGLKNQGATGYMNTSLQLLYCITYFRKAIYQIPTENSIPEKSIPLALQRVFYQLQTSDTTVETVELTKSFGWDSLDSFMQHDVLEFNRVLIDNLEGKMKGTRADGAITRLFVGKMKSYTKCVNVDYESSRVEYYYDIGLNVKGLKTLKDSFGDYIQQETTEYHVRGGLQDAVKGVIFESFPPVLYLQLKRFEYDIKKDAMVKVGDRFEYPMEIDLEEFLSENADRSSSHKYLLHGVLIHSGGLHGGRYWALLKPEKDGKWFKFDDDRVTPVIEREVFEDNYGGHNRSTNAYILVYIRESDVDEILSPVSSEDVPEHLIRRAAEEKALKEQKKKEMEEGKLYLHVKIVTAEKFKNHQGFDLANFGDHQYPPSDVYVFKVLKCETYETFVNKHISRNFNISPKNVRFWALVTRQNKTCRPDSIIPESHFKKTMEEIRASSFPRQHELRLYMEVADKFPTDNGDCFMVFIKYFDPDTQALEGLGHLYVRRLSKVGDYTQILCEKKGFPPDTPLILYEEIKPNMIEKMRLSIDFRQSELMDGDIICFQKDLKEEEIQEYTRFGRIYSVPQFYELLNSRITTKSNR